MAVVGNNFATVWEEKESVAIVLTVQQIFAARELRAADLVRVFGEFDELGSMSLTLHEFSEALALLRVKLRREQTYRLFKCFDQVRCNVRPTAFSHADQVRGAQCPLRKERAAAS